MSVSKEYQQNTHNMIARSCESVQMRGILETLGPMGTEKVRTAASSLMKSVRLLGPRGSDITGWGRIHSLSPGGFTAECHTFRAHSDTAGCWGPLVAMCQALSPPPLRVHTPPIIATVQLLHNSVCHQSFIKEHQADSRDSQLADKDVTNHSK